MLTPEEEARWREALARYEIGRVERLRILAEGALAPLRWLEGAAAAVEAWARESA